MNNLAIVGGTVFDWVRQTSWQAAVLAGLILLVQRLLRERLAPQWRYRLWLLLVVRLVMPVTPQSGFSVFNVIRWQSASLRSAANSRPPAWFPDPARSPAAQRNVAPGGVAASAPLPSDDAPQRVQREPTAEPLAAAPAWIPLAQLHHPVSWRQLVLWGWLAGCVVLGARLCWLHTGFGLRLATYGPVRDRDVLELFEQCRTVLGVRARIELIETEEVITPALFGFWRKRLLLPDGTFERFTAAELRHIFLHELAHVRRRDLELNWLTSFLQALHWFNPALWFAFGRMRCDRELATDALALSVSREREATVYGETLLKVLAGLHTGSAIPGLVGIAERKERIKERLRAIARRGTTRSWRWLAVLALMTLAAVALTDAMHATQPKDETSNASLRPSVPSAKSDPAGAPLESGERRFTLAVLDYETGAPLNGATVDFGVEHYSIATTQRLTTDTGGLASLVFSSSDLKKFSYLASKPEYLALRGEWHKQEIVPLPERYEIKLSRGVEISGVVVDDRGTPLNGAEIYFDRPMNMGLAASPVNSETWTAPAGQRLAVTDSTGRWKARCIWPTVQWAELRVRHRGFADAAYSTQTTKAMETEGKGHALHFQDLAAGRAKFVLTPGLTLRGRVLDPEGKPLPGLTVRYADRPSDNPFWDSVMGKGTETTDARGTFRIEDLPPKHIFLSIQAAGYAPVVGEIDLDAEHRQVELRLTEPQKLVGTVISHDGTAVSGAEVSFHDWSIWQGVRWTAVTDQNGRFEWTDAPGQKFQVFVEKDGFIPMRKTLTGGGEQKIRINPVLKLSGKVTNAKTKEPVKQFRITFSDREEYLQYSRGEGLSGTNGEYGLDLGRLYASSWVDNYFFQFVFRVEADGFVPVNSRVFSSRNGDVGEHTYDLELEPAKMLAGTVVDAAGHPVAGAQLALKSPKTRLRLAGKPQFEDLDKIGFPVSGAGGAFRLGVDPEATYLIAVHDKGFARLRVKELGDSATVRLQPWAQLAGTVMQYDKPLPKEEVMLQWREETDFVPGSIELVNMKTTSDGAGQFQFDYVPPGKCSLNRWIPKLQGAASSAPELVLAKAGEMATVNVGGKGRPIVGRFKVKNPYVPIEWQKDHHTIGTVVPRPPDSVKTREDYEAWRKQPDIARAYDQIRNYPVIFAEDGSFRIDEVVPGAYQFSMQIYDPTDPDAFAYSRYIGRFNGTFTVPEGSDANSRKPLDVGAFELTLNPKIEPGKTAAPEFTASDLAGKGFKLSDYRGQYVLLDFWATWCGPCLAEMPYLKKAYETFGARTNFTMISLSLDKSVAEPSSFAEKSGIKWPQGYLGPWEKTQVPSSYGVQGIPALFLVSPDGKILASGIDGYDLQSTLQKHLGH